MTTIRKSLSQLLLLASVSPAAYSHSAIDQTALFEECRVIPHIHNYRYNEAQFDACRALVQTDSIHIDAHFYLGRLLYAEGRREEAEELFRTGYAAGSTKAALAYAFINGGYRPGVLRIAEENARAIYREAAYRGDPVAKVLLGLDKQMIEPEPSEEDKITAFNLYQEAAQMGYPVANLYLGEFYLYYCPEETDDCREKSIKYLQQAAAGGVRDAVLRLKAFGKETNGFGPLDDMLYQSPVPEAMILLRP